MTPPITFCLTSCNRPELLERTLKSFFKYNTAKIDRFIIVDDSGVQGCIDEVVKKFPSPIEVFYNPVRIGMMPSIDVLYSKVNTPLIFHCEDDWEFSAGGFIEKSYLLLKTFPNLITVWLRKRDDTNGHPIDPVVNEILSMKFGSVKYSSVSPGYMGKFHGYTTNPGLRRLEDVTNFTELVKDAPGHGEENVSEYYYKKGFRAVLLEPGYITHIGEGLSCGLKQ